VTADRAWEELASLDLLNKGFLTTTQLQGCVSAVTTPAQIDGLVAAIETAVRAS